MRKMLSVVATLATLSILSFPAQAGLTGSSVFGTLCFNVGANCQFWNPQNAIVGAGVEYFYTDGANDDSADFSNLQLVVTDLVKSNANGWQMTFTDAAFAGLSVTEFSDNFTNGGVNGALVGNVLTLTWLGTSTRDGLLTAVYNFAPNAVPEPASLALLGIGLAGLGFSRRKAK